jgi:hypothetical protein
VLGQHSTYLASWDLPPMSGLRHTCTESIYSSMTSLLSGTKKVTVQ